MRNRTSAARCALPWFVAAGLLLSLLLLIGVGYWRSTAVGPQVQTPMFYDAHYLYPRPWTQEQAAPGVPPPAPLAFYGPNHVSQPFVSGGDNLAMVEVWLAGPADTAVSASLADERGVAYSGQISLTQGPAGGYYRLRFPPLAAARGRTFWLTLAAEGATAAQPVVTRTVGGDRLGGSLRVNEYPRPGNLALRTYARGGVGAWWPAAIAEQLLPQVFRLRVQQYKPAPFKGPAFGLLLAATAVLSSVFLVLARPNAIPSRGSLWRALGWSLAGVLGLFLLWQVGDGRVRLPFAGQTTTLAPTAAPLTLAQTDVEAERLIYDFPSSLWVSRREPEARFVSSDVVEGVPAIRVPADSRLGFALVVPPNGRFCARFAPVDTGALAAEVRLGDEVVAAAEATAAAPARFDVDLSPWAGTAVILNLVSRPADESAVDAGVWLMPQLSAAATWLLPATAESAAQPAEARFGEAVALAGYTAAPAQPQPGDSVAVTLYWRPLRTPESYAVVFVHVLNGSGNIIAQHDAQPVNGAYPLPAWQPGTLIADGHTLRLPDDAPPGPYTLAVGLYDPETLQRWPVVLDDSAATDNRLLLPLSPREATP